MLISLWKTTTIKKLCNNVFYLNAKKLFFTELLSWKYLTKQQIMEWRIFYDGLDRTVI